MHSPTCSGCPKCNTEYRSLLSMTPAQHCAWLQKRGIPKESTMREDFAPPDPYALALAARAASEHQTPATQFEDRYKAERLRALAAEHAEFDARKAPAPRLTAAQLAPYEPPDTYKAGL